MKPIIKETEMAQINAATTTFDSMLYNASAALRREMEEHGKIVTNTHYKPTDWSVDGTKELMDGWKEAWGTCPACFTLRSASGACNC